MLFIIMSMYMILLSNVPLCAMEDNSDSVEIALITEEARPFILEQAQKNVQKANQFMWISFIGGMVLVTWGTYNTVKNHNAAPEFTKILLGMFDCGASLFAIEYLKKTKKVLAYL